MAKKKDIPIYAEDMDEVQMGCKNGHRWIAEIYLFAGDWWYRDKSDMRCPKCKAIGTAEEE